jgi:hypothetical protein
MSDAEHAYLVETASLRGHLTHVREIARRALRAAISAQEASSGQHEDWLDADLVEVELASRC